MSDPAQSTCFPTMVGILLYCLLAGLTSYTHAQMQPSPVDPPYGATAVEQVAFDSTNRTLYLASSAGHCIVQAFDVSYAPLTPPATAFWAYAVVAGRLGTNGPPGLKEVTSTDANFSAPSGVVGWPQYAVGPTTAIPRAGDAASAISSSSSSWVGLWIADQWNHAIRFIHFHRGSNVTLVAGSPNQTAGMRNGIGAATLFYYPKNLAWGRFLRLGVMDPHPPSGSRISSGAWTSVVFWSDQWNHCVRQGVPLHNDTTYSPLGDVTTASGAAATLRDMVLNVTTFAGLCNDGLYGTGVGPVVPLSPMFRFPWGMALAGLPTAVNTTTTLLFVADNYNHRISMIAPMYPMHARTLTVVHSDVSSDLAGITISRISSLSFLRPPRGPSLYAVNAVAVELMVGTDDSSLTFRNISVVLWVNTSNQSSLSVATSVLVYQGLSNVTVSVQATTQIAYAWNTAMVRYSPNSSYNGTMVAFTGYNGDLLSNHVLEYDCCLDAAYSDPILLQDTTMRSMREKTRTWSVTPSVSSTGSGSSTGSVSWSVSWSRSRPVTLSRSRGWTRSSTQTNTPSTSMTTSRTKRRTIEKKRRTTTGSSSSSSSGSSVSRSSILRTATHEASTSRSDGSQTMSRSHPSPSRPSGTRRQSLRRSSSLSRSLSRSISPTSNILSTATHWIVAPPPPTQQEASKVLAETTTGSTSTALSTMAFVSTTPVMSLQRMNGILGILSCRSLDPTMRPSTLSNPSQDKWEWKTADYDGPPSSTPVMTRLGPNVLAPYWRLTWWWLLGQMALGFGVCMIICVLQVSCEWECLYINRTRSDKTKANK